MTEPRAQTPRARRATPASSLRDTLVSVAALAVVAAVVVWSLLLMDLLRKRSDAAATPGATPRELLATPGPGQPAQTPAAVTTRAS